MKNIIFGTGIVVTLTTLGFVLAGQLELTTFGVINTTVLSILYGWYQKLMKNEVTEELVLSNLELEYVKHNHNELLKEVDSATAILPELQKVVESTIDEVEETKPKRKRNIKK